MSDSVSSSENHSRPSGPSAGGAGPTGEGSRQPEANSTHSFLDELLYRRVPQVLAGYLGVTWTLFELMQWLTERYLVSPYLGRALLLGLLLLLPAVLVVTYRHGRPGLDQWTSKERWTIVGNVAVAVLALVAVFGDVELGSMVRTVQTTAADTIGRRANEKVVRQVPKKQFRRRVALFYFDAAENARADTALRRAAPTALRTDLEQDPFVNITSPARFGDELRRRGYDEGLSVPLGLKREVAQEANAGYVLSGHVGTAGNGAILLSTRLRETETGDLVAERRFEGKDLFDAVDQASIQLKKDLDLPDGHLESVTDLPVTQVFTASDTAAKYYAQGRYLRRFTEVATQRAARTYSRATDADTTFALGYLQKGRALWRLGKREKASRAFESAKRHSYRLSESWTYWLKATRLYRLEGRPEAALQVCEQWTSLHPYDLRGWAVKAAVQEGLLRYEQALASYRRMLELAPESKGVKRRIVTTLLRTGQLKNALGRAESYAEAYPKEGEGPLFVGIIQWRMGQLTEAEEAFRQAERLETQNAGLYLSVLHQARGRFETALSKIKEIARERNGGGTRFRGAGPHLWHHHWLRGRIDRSRDILDSLRASKPEGANIFYRSDLLLRTCDYYGPPGNDALTDDALHRLQMLRTEVSAGIPAQQIATEVSLARCKITADRLAEAQQHLERATTLIERPETPLDYRLSFALDYLWGRLREAQGRYRDAATRYERYIDDASPRSLLLRTRRLPGLRLARAYQKAGRTGEARTAYQEALALHPAYPRLNYHYAQFLVDRGRREAARTHLRRALEGWAPADSDFRLRQRAEALADSLGLSIV